MTPSTFFQECFNREPEVLAAAPGRLEFIGNHTDYNGGLVMGVAVDRGIQVAIAKRTDKRLQFCSSSLENIARATLDDIRPLSGSESWANYALGVLDQLIKAEMAIDCGFDMAVVSNLPAGAGMSSSAAFELASGMAIGKLFGFEQSTADWARLARRAENQFVGVPCGILDQGVSAFGKKDQLVHIDCNTETFGRVPMPKGVHFWVFNSGVKHALLDSLYATRHKECMDALKILQGIDASLTHLAAVPAKLIEANKDALGEDMYKRALHISNETQRVRDMESALEQNDLAKAGKLLTASHESSRDLFGNSCPELDYLVELLKNMPHVYGCRLTGGGFGGAVMTVTSPEFSEAEAQQVSKAYSGKFDHAPSIFHTLSGDGARILG